MEAQQLTFFDALMDLFIVNPICLIGVIILAGLLIWSLKGEQVSTKISVSLASLLLLYYLFISLVNVFGIATLRDFSRLGDLGESVFNPNIELIPFTDGFSLSFLLNIVAFMPIGFLLPFISPAFKNIKKVILSGLLLSLTIEISQLFTLYRATDINDLLTNTLGVLLGYCCYLLIAKLFLKNKKDLSSTNKRLQLLPPVVLLIGFLTIFLLF
ncbi:VanZ family protein [Enterococcus sp. LJL128]|uniref:VanZ family protein n=1 Tax=Enterococcus sp. LJL51 TaxID=3416656 RepID=UPI003CEEC035